MIRGENGLAYNSDLRTDIKQVRRQAHFPGTDPIFEGNNILLLIIPCMASVDRNDWNVSSFDKMHVIRISFGHVVQRGNDNSA